MSRRVTRFQDTKGNSRNGSRQDSDSGDSLANLPFTSEYSLEPKKIVWLFEECFKYILGSEQLQENIQAVKADLFNRDYLAAFNNDDKRFAYAARWTPARALSYSSLFSSLAPIRDLFADENKHSRVLCVGGGASGELVGLAAVFCRLKEYNPSSPSKLDVNIVDIADWTSVTTALTRYIKSNWVYDESKFDTNFTHGDILVPGSYNVDISSLDLVSILFTTNELFTEKRKETIQFLQLLNKSCKSGSYLLIAESAGSYSHIEIGTKKFPVQFLIDMILVGKQGENNGPWEIVQQSDSIWYRINENEVNYPMKLENMRFFYRLYKKK